MLLSIQKSATTVESFLVFFFFCWVFTNDILWQYVIFTDEIKQVNFFLLTRFVRL